VLRLLCDDPSALGGGPLELLAPNGTRVELAAWNAPLLVPELRPSFVLTRLGAGAGWGTGRAGMRYRDLVPGRQGGRFIASHILIPEAGPVPDYVHRHRVRFQLIYCYRGFVRVVYEDQGPPFVLEAGDAVLQPPEIRHRVLESSAGLEVIEVSCPAEHETLADLELELPTPSARPERGFGGQRFVRHQAARADWASWHVPGFEARDLGVAAATRGLAGALVARWRGRASGSSRSEDRLATHDAEFLFWFVLEGAATLDSGAHGQERVSAGDSLVIPAGRTHALRDCSSDLELLQVALPAGFASVVLAPERTV
jgi:mannose-6-phosphate isomerase-like protein (cupin superfamily)